jgi:hypothetical protein
MVSVLVAALRSCERKRSHSWPSESISKASVYAAFWAVHHEVDEERFMWARGQHSKPMPALAFRGNGRAESTAWGDVVGQRFEELGQFDPGDVCQRHLEGSFGSARSA